jgi:hypothetical protein
MFHKWTRPIVTKFQTVAGQNCWAEKRENWKKIWKVLFLNELMTLFKKIWMRLKSALQNILFFKLKHDKKFFDIKFVC